MTRRLEDSVCLVGESVTTARLRRLAENATVGTGHYSVGDAYRAFEEVIDPDLILELLDIADAGRELMKDALAEPIGKDGVRHYDLAVHGGPIGDLFRAVEAFENEADAGAELEECDGRRD